MVLASSAASKARPCPAAVTMHTSGACRSSGVQVISAVTRSSTSSGSECAIPSASTCCARYRSRAGTANKLVLVGQQQQRLIQKSQDNRRAWRELGQWVEHRRQVERFSICASLEQRLWRRRSVDAALINDENGCFRQVLWLELRLLADLQTFQHYAQIDRLSSSFNPV